jgi:hypothetical protein
MSRRLDRIVGAAVQRRRRVTSGRAIGIIGVGRDRNGSIWTSSFRFSVVGVVSRYRRFMGEKEAESYEDLRSYAQAIKGDEEFAQRVLKAARRNPVARMDLTERGVASVVGGASAVKSRYRQLL